MASASAVAFNQIPSLSNFRKLAAESPSEAKAALTRVVSGLSKSAANAEQVAGLKALLQLDGARFSAEATQSKALPALFPEAPSAASFADVIAQMSNLPSLNWTADSVPPQIAVTGNVVRDASNQYTLTTASGRTYQLHDSTRSSGVSGGWLEGFLNQGEGAMTVQGTVSADGKSFLVEGYAPGSSPDFVMGRVVVKTPMGDVTGKPTPDQLAEALGPNGRVIITGARGEVEVTNPELKKVLATMPRLGIILPGVVERSPEGKLSIASGPDFLYALGGRFKGLTEKGNGVWATDAAFAFNHFMGPVEASGDTAKWRMQNSANQRNWVGGAFKLDAPTPYFAATYISNDLGDYSLGNANGKTEGTAPLQLLAASEVVDPAADFQRAMGPVPATTPAQ